ncbi:Enhancer of polycomb-like protein 1, partial [Coemansia sp. RSA 2603]
MANAQRFRARKVDLKRALPVYRASDLDDLDDDDNRQVDMIETGVEKDEEAEHHLQAAISATHAAASGSAPAKQVYIPTPDASRVTASYAQLYARPFTCPTSLVRSSETVEESCGPMYCADAEDLRWAEDHGVAPEDLELGMDALESVARDMVFQGLADVPSAEYLATSAAERDQPGAALVPRVYEHWRARRASRGFSPLLAHVQTHDGTGNEISPYVCFRRREVRQGRKTRRADQRSLEQLRRLRSNLAAAVQLLEMCGARERDKLALVQAAQEVSRARTHVLQARRRLHVDGSTEDLFVAPAPRRQRQAPQTQRPRARKPRAPSVPGHASVGAGAGAADMSPFVLPRSVVVPQYPVPPRMALLAEQTHARWALREQRLGGWVDATFAPAVSHSTGFWAPPLNTFGEEQEAGRSAAFRVRVGRLGRVFVDRRAVRRVGDAVRDVRVRRVCAGLLR